ncbi:hypothetical protein B0T18DRAFT_448049 [Schizothecium vesticola]|uniref:Uncharacterized protein n=1 Tax=Schizothecium vesticola TaxID=314040 RepID=A0AA40EPW9_9PEZI|nr:hypothetical protein B0T18DRAFT_448049 [Schizothecium vesticola]
MLLPLPGGGSSNSPMGLWLMRPSSPISTMIRMRRGSPLAKALLPSPTPAPSRKEQNSRGPVLSRTPMDDVTAETTMTDSKQASPPPHARRPFVRRVFQVSTRGGDDIGQRDADVLGGHIHSSVLWPMINPIDRSERVFGEPLVDVGEEQPDETRVRGLVILSVGVDGKVLKDVVGVFDHQAVEAADAYVIGEERRQVRFVEGMPF